MAACTEVLRCEFLFLPRCRFSAEPGGTTEGYTLSHNSALSEEWPAACRLTPARAPNTARLLL